MDENKLREIVEEVGNKIISSWKNLGLNTKIRKIIRKNFKPGVKNY